MRGHHFVAMTAIVALCAPAPAAAGLINIDFSFEDDFVTPLSNGQVIDTEFGNLFNLSSSGANAGLAIFDSTSGVNAPDPDLWVNTGNILILQESNFPDQTGGFFDSPNDDLDGGTIFFDFLSPVELVSIDLFDIDTVNQAATLILTDGSGNARTYDVPDAWTGDISLGDPGLGTLDLTALTPQAGFMSSATAMEDLGFDPADVVQLAVTFQGSGGLDNLRIVPAPAAAIALVGGLLLVTRRRR